VGLPETGLTRSIGGCNAKFKWMPVIQKAAVTVHSCDDFFPINRLLSTMTLKYAHLAPGFLESRAKVVSFSSVGTDTSGLKLIVSK
jgi:hypothetical protein